MAMRTQGFAPNRGPVQRALGEQRDGGRWWNNPRMIEQLKLTDDQRKAMDQIFYDHREKLIDLEANLQKAELAMEPLMSADQPDQKAMEAQIDKVVTARGDLERANALFLLDIRMKLTPDQWKQLRNSRADMGRERPSRGPGAQQRFRNRRNGQGGPASQSGPGQQPPAGGSAPAGPPPGGGSGEVQ